MGNHAPLCFMWYTMSMDTKTLLRAKKGQLEEWAEIAGVSTDGTREDLIERLLETQRGPVSTYSDPNEKVLVRYNRKNPSFTVSGYEFTKKNPFVAVPRHVADHIFNTFEGFFPATPQEVEEFYS